jgi:hypothetical protein
MLRITNVQSPSIIFYKENVSSLKEYVKKLAAEIDAETKDTYTLDMGDKAVYFTHDKKKTKAMLVEVLNKADFTDAQWTLFLKSANSEEIQKVTIEEVKIEEPKIEEVKIEEPKVKEPKKIKEIKENVRELLPGQKPELKSKYADRLWETLKIVEAEKEANYGDRGDATAINALEKEIVESGDEEAINDLIMILLYHHIWDWEKLEINNVSEEIKNVATIENYSKKTITQLYQELLQKDEQVSEEMINSKKNILRGYLFESRTAFEGPLNGAKGSFSPALDFGFFGPGIYMSRLNDNVGNVYGPKGYISRGYAEKAIWFDFSDFKMPKFSETVVDTPLVPIPKKFAWLETNKIALYELNRLQNSLKANPMVAINPLFAFQFEKETKVKLKDRSEEIYDAKSNTYYSYIFDYFSLMQAVLKQALPKPLKMAEEYLKTGIEPKARMSKNAADDFYEYITDQSNNSNMLFPLVAYDALTQEGIDLVIAPASSHQSGVEFLFLKNNFKQIKTLEFTDTRKKSKSKKA